MRRSGLLLLALLALCVLAGCGEESGKVKRNDAGVLVAPFTGTTTKLPRRPIAVAAGGGSVWVSSMAGGVLSRIDPKNGEPIGDPVELDDAPYQLLYAFDKLWAATLQNDKLFRISPRDGQVIGATKVENRPFGLAAGFGSIWVTSIRNETLRRVDPDSGKPFGPPVELSGPPYKVIAAGDSLWVTNLRDGVVDRVDPASNKVIVSIPIGDRSCTQAALERSADQVNEVVTDCGAPAALAYAGGYVWVSNLRGPAVKTGEATDVQIRQGIPNGQVWRIDPATNKVVGKPIAVPVRPLAMAADSSSVWVIGVETDTLLRIDTKTARRDELPIEIGNAPTDVTLGYGKVWVPLSRDDELAALSISAR